MTELPEKNFFIEKKVKNKLTNSVYPYLLTTFPLIIFAGAILFYKFYQHVNTLALTTWFSALVFLVICQAALGIWFQKTKHNLKWEHLYYKFLILNAGLIGLAWGIAGIAFMPDDEIGQSYLIFTLAFVAAGGLLYLAESYLAGAVYISGILIPLASILFFGFASHDYHEIYYNLSLAVMLYWGFLLTLNYYASKLYKENLKLHIINKTLGDDLLNSIETHEKISSFNNSKIFATPSSHPLPKHIGNLIDALTGADSKEVAEIKFALTRGYAHRHHQGMAVFSIGIKNINDLKNKLNKEELDLLNKEMITRLQHNIRETDILFQSTENKCVVILSEVLLGNEIRLVTNKVFKVFEKPFLVNKTNIAVNIAIGISLFPHDGENLQELITKADIALSHVSTESDSADTNFQIYDQTKMQLS